MIKNLLFSSKSWFSLGKFIILLLLLTNLFSLAFDPLVKAEIIGEDKALDQLESDYNQKKDDIQGQINNISGELDKIIDEQSKLQIQKNTLTGQVNSVKSEISEVDSLIVDTKLVIQQIESNIAENQEDIESQNNEIRNLLLQIQKKNKISPIQTLFSSRSLGSALNEIYSLTNLQNQVEEAKQELERATQKLEDNKVQNEQVKEQLEKSRGLLKSKQEGLDSLLNQTQGQETEYQKLLTGIKDQKQELESQLGSINGEYLAEIQDLRSQFENEDIEDSPTNCSFEEKTPLTVPKGFFGPPTTGYITQKFHCRHDGIDISNGKNTDITSIADGEVVRLGTNNNGCVGLSCNGGFGNFIVVKHTLPTGNRVYSLYAHLNDVSPRQVGEKVTKGEVIGKMGCTGYTLPYPCGVHVHFVMLTESFEQYGLGCRLGGSKCYNPSQYIPGL